MAGEAFSSANGHCERARQWSSLRLDGELSELEEARLEKHLESCAVCRSFDVRMRSTTEIVRTAPALRPAARFEVPAARWAGVPAFRILAVAGVVAAAALGSLVGSTLDRPAPKAQKPAAQVSLLTRDVSQLRQLPRNRPTAPAAPAREPGGPPEGII